MIDPRETPDLLRLAVEHGATNPPGNSLLHGEAHWKAVALTGLFLGRQLADVDLRFIFSFAVIHDTMRQDDDEDPEHGKRAADLFGQLADADLLDELGFAYDDARTLDMKYALEHHVGGIHARAYPDINVGLCWDADRLNLWRVGIEPDNRFLTTPIARTFEAKEFGWTMCQRQVNYEPFPSWNEIEFEVEKWQRATKTA